MSLLNLILPSALVPVNLKLSSALVLVKPNTPFELKLNVRPVTRFELILMIPCNEFVLTPVWLDTGCQGTSGT